MSTTVTYKGVTITTAENQTRTLKTAGKYMEADVVVTDVTSTIPDGDNLSYGSVSAGRTGSARTGRSTTGGTI